VASLSVHVIQLFFGLVGALFSVFHRTHRLGELARSALLATAAMLMLMRVASAIAA
jgi:hypothetical protein